MESFTDSHGIFLNRQDEPVVIGKRGIRPLLESWIAYGHTTLTGHRHDIRPIHRRCLHPVGDRWHPMGRAPGTVSNCSDAKLGAILVEYRGDMPRRGVDRFGGFWF